MSVREEGNLEVNPAVALGVWFGCKVFLFSSTLSMILTKNQVN